MRFLIFRVPLVFFNDLSLFLFLFAGLVSGRYLFLNDDLFLNLAAGRFQCQHKCATLAIPWLGRPWKLNFMEACRADLLREGFSVGVS